MLVVWLRLLWVSIHLGLLAEWSPSDEFDAVQAASSVSDHTNVWTDGSLVLDRVTGVSSSGAFFFLPTSLTTGGVHEVGVMWMVFVQMIMFRLAGASFQFLGISRSVQRAEMWGVILALYSGAVHLGVDNLGVVRHVGRLLD